MCPFLSILAHAIIYILYYLHIYHKQNLSTDVNWGSTTQAQTYKNALTSVQQLNNVEEHVKNYRPQILLLTHLPNTRPILVDLAYMLTKNLSLMVCGHINQGAGTTQKYRNFMQRRATDWFKKHKVKAFYSLIDGEDFESGARALMQASGIGKLKPNILLMGYKNDWRTCEPRTELSQYFNTIHKALDIHLAVAILRMPKGLDYSSILGDDVPLSIYEIPKTLQPTDSSADLKAAHATIHGSCDSLSRNVSQGLCYERE